MSFNNDFTNFERELLLELIHDALRVANRFELFIWLQARLQYFMPHKILIAARGDFSLGLILSSVHGLRTNGFTQDKLSPPLKKLDEATPLVKKGEEVDNLLSEREKEIMPWVKQGKTNLEIGMILDFSNFTVKKHLQRIFKKLDVLNRVQAVSTYNT